MSLYGNIQSSRLRAAIPLARLAALACLGWALAAPSPRAQETLAHPVDSTLKMLNMKTDPGSMPGFVEQSRPQAPKDFVPIGTQHPTRPIKAKTPAEIAAATAELDAARDAQLAGKRPKPRQPDVKPIAKSAKAPPKVATDH